MNKKEQWIKDTRQSFDRFIAYKKEMWEERGRMEKEIKEKDKEIEKMKEEAEAMKVESEGRIGALRKQCTTQKKEIMQLNRRTELSSTLSPVMTLAEEEPTPEVQVVNDVEMTDADKPATPPAPKPKPPMRKAKGKTSDTSTTPKPWETPKNWRKAETRKEKMEEKKGVVPTKASMAKAVVIHAVPTGWNVGWVGNTVEKKLGKVLGARWLLGPDRRVGKSASSVVIYLDRELLVGEKAQVQIGGGKHLMVPYNFKQ